MNITDVIIAPLITEKTHLLKMEEKPKISFVVDRRANKIEIKQAFASVFGFPALAVNTLIRKPQPARHTAKSKKNYTKAFKVAHITVSKEDYASLKTAIEAADPK